MAESGTSMREAVLERLEQGPVQLLANGGHPDCDGLAPEATGRVLRAELNGPSELEPASSSASMLRLPRRAPDGAGEVRLPWEAVFYVAGVDASGRRRTRIAERGLPRELGDPSEVRRLAAAHGLAPADPSRAPNWRLVAPPELHEGHADRSRFEPNKRRAIQRLLERGSGWLVLAVDRPRSLVVLDGGRRAAQLELTGVDVRWYAAGAEAPPTHRLRWSEIGAVRDLATDEGWFWPGDLPEDLARALSNRRRDRELVRHEQGVPLTPRHPLPPVHVLPTPPERDRRRVLEHHRERGETLLLVDPSHERVRLPPSLAAQPAVAVPLQLEGRPLPCEVTRTEVRTALRNDDGLMEPIVIPWSAIFAIQEGERGRGAICWPESYPAAIVDVLRRASASGPNEAGAPPAPNENGCGLQLDRTTEGDRTLRLVQQTGRTHRGEPLRLDVAVALDPPG